MTDAQYAAGLRAYWHAPTEAEGWILLCASGFPVSPMPPAKAVKQEELALKVERAA